MATSGVFRQTAGPTATQYHGTAPRDKGLGGQPDPSAQIQRFYGRSENQPYLNPYHGRPVIDQTLGDQFGEPKYELNVGTQIKNLVMMDAEQPWFTIILPLQETDVLTITGTIWKFNRRLPRPTPYHAPSPYVSEEWEEFRQQLQRYGESIRMESDFFHTPEGMQNFMLKLTGIASDMVEGIRFDVMRELLRSIDQYKRYYSLKTFTEDPMKDIMARVALFASLNKAPTKYDELGVVTEKLERALHDVVPGPYELIVPPEWGIFFSRVNQTPAPQPYYFQGNLFIENGPTPKGIIGRNRFWEYPDVTVETGAIPLRMLQRRVSICEHYMSSFKGRDMDLGQKFTGLLAGTKDVGRMRNIIVYSADEDRPVELKIQDMIEYGSIVPDSYTKTGNTSIDPYNHGESAESLRKYYNNMGTEAEKYFYPQGIYDVDANRGSLHRGISGKMRAAPIWLYWEPKDTWKEKGVTEHVQIVKYSGETDENVQSPLDHLNQGQILTAKLITKFSLDRIGTHYSNAVRLHHTLANATCNDTYMKAWIISNLENNIDADLSGAGPNYTAQYIGSELTRANDPEYWDYWSGAIKKPSVPEFGPGSGGYYEIPPQSESGGLTIPPGCDSAIGIMSIANISDVGGSGWGDIVNQVKTHYEVLLSMIDVARLLPDSELVNPLNRAPWVHSTDPDVGALDVVYSNAVSQFHPPAFIRLHKFYTFTAQHPNTGDEIDVSILFPISHEMGSITSLNVGSAVTGSFPDDEDEEDEEVEYEEGAMDADARIGGIKKKTVRGVSRPGPPQPIFLRTALSFTPGMKASMDKGELTLAFPADESKDFALPMTPPPLSTKRRRIRTVEEGKGKEAEEEEEEEDEGPVLADIDYSIANISKWSRTLPSIKPWRNGKPREFEHYALNMTHGLRYGLTRNGQFNSVNGSNRNKLIREQSERRRRSKGRGISSSGANADFSSWGSTPSRSIRSGLLGSKRRGSLGSRRAYDNDDDYDDDDEEGRGSPFGKTMESGAREAHKWSDMTKPLGGSNRPSLFMGKDRRWSKDRSKGYEVIKRFSSSNFIMKMKYITDAPGDPDVFFAIAAMMSRQDKKEHWMKLVKHHLHLAVDFLMFRIVEVMTESAILLKAGLGMTAINHSDYKNGEVVSTKTYHGHLTVHYGAIVVYKDWLMMMEDMKLTGYLGGKGKGFMKHPRQLMHDQGSTGHRERSVICMAMPIGCDYLPVLSISGHWQMPEVVPKNIPENGYLFNGVDWYERIWGFKTKIEKDRPKLDLYRTKGHALPQVSFVGWHMSYDITEAKFMVANNGQGHLKGGDYQGAKAVMEGHKTWFDTPPLEEIRVF
jgi:hypothetical protein